MIDPGSPYPKIPAGTGQLTRKNLTFSFFEIMIRPQASELRPQAPELRPQVTDFGNALSQLKHFRPDRSLPIWFHTEN